MCVVEGGCFVDSDSLCSEIGIDKALSECLMIMEVERNTRGAV